MKKYAKVEWTAEDVLTLRPDMGPTAAEEFLQSNERRIRDRLVELGWEVIESLLEYEDE